MRALGLLLTFLGGCVCGDGFCNLDGSDPRPPTCGDGAVDEGEECDGSLACTSQCTLITPRLSVSWSWNDPDLGGVHPDGYTQVEVVAARADGNGNPIGTPHITTQPFTALTTTLDLSPSDLATTYAVSFAIQKDPSCTDCDAEYARSQPVLVHVLEQSSVALVIHDNAGFAKISWQLRGAQSGEDLRCSDTGVDIRITVGGTPFDIECSLGPTIEQIGPIDAGSQDVVVDATSNGGISGTSGSFSLDIPDRSGLATASVIVLMPGL